MGTAPTAIILTGYAVDPVLVRGGAQRVAAEICDRLTELGWTLHVVECAAWQESIGPDNSFVAGMAGYSSTSRRWRDAGSAKVMEAGDVNAVVGDARLVLVLDRAVGRLSTSAHRVLLLSNLAYDNERRAAAHGDHDAVWVPSPYLAKLFVTVPGHAVGDVHVVPPALTASRCDTAAHVPLQALQERLTEKGVPRHRRLLFPHRADPGKGLITALAVLRQLLAEGRWTLVLVGPGTGEGADAIAVVDEARQYAADADITDHLMWVPWLPQGEMRCLYRLTGITLMPTTLDEGFGLVAIESVTQGVPVVAWPAGNLRLLADLFPSIRLADDIVAMARTTSAVSGLKVPDLERHAGSRMYSVDAQRAAVTAALYSGAIPG